MILEEIVGIPFDMLKSDGLSDLTCKRLRVVELWDGRYDHALSVNGIHLAWYDVYQEDWTKVRLYSFLGRMMVDRWLLQMHKKSYLVHKAGIEKLLQQELTRV